ncbi:hypothetical protein N7468_003059 [Penicillium chermesinum]|uniref:Nuclear pore complex protein An-Nup82 n=1 Tax=Penicillium chermesinum TaxID=63820 RepID=A0A9W9P6B9_9EURO|nr:uncharacterized protein N7468_003059 [Penicillium chermesinum]KAJ5238440.1 hypothetical protein N7468_003059 [Penicillium chermesinum]KAJ6164098.1 hypothetical protein N7470_002770 [Penicillium chermesinum]
MPKVNSFAPAWLCRPSPGASLFTSSAIQSPADQQNGAKSALYNGPTKTIAKRGTEIFTVVDNEIRWADLARLKEQWQQQQARQKKGAIGAKPITDLPSYRVLSVPVSGSIRQILPSPNGAFLAIITDNTVHISVLPDTFHLSSLESSSIRLKTYQLGPTTHVIPESPVVSALWHPLGIHTSLTACIVTITKDAVVRVWELDRNNHWSFDQPTLAVDLTKLVDGTSSDQDFKPGGFGKSKGFSADLIDMEVVSACFAGSGNEKEDAWAPMTLWVAMRPGDIYALCPLLPTKWQAPPTTIPSLSSAIIPKLAALEGADEDVEEELIACRQQYEWLREIDDQEPLYVPAESAVVQGADIFTRPDVPSSIPRLQGPYRFDAGNDELDDLDLCDILVIAAGLDVEDLMMGEEEELAVAASGQEKLSATVICLTNTSGRVYICLEVDGVEGQWLPKAKKNSFRTPASEPADLILVESLDTMKQNEQHEASMWPTFSPDISSRYSFYVTTPTKVVSFSMASWVQRLETELQAEDLSGSDFRLQVLCSGDVAQRDKILEVSDTDVTAPQDHLATCLVFYDFDIGYLVLTYHPSNPYAAIMDSPEDSFSVAMGGASLVPAIFYATSPLESFVEKHVPHRQRHTLKEHVRLSPATLDLITTAHRVVSTHTNALERAASDLFRRCERLRDELQDQLKQISDAAERIKGLTSEIAEDGTRKEGARNGEALNRRMQAASDRQKQLVERYDALRKKVKNSGGRALSEKEKAWANEVNMLTESFDIQASNQEDQSRLLAHRLETVKRLAADLISETKSIAARSVIPAEPSSPSSPGGSQPKVPQRLQRAKVADAMRMVERESAVIDAITSRLDRLNTSL